MTLKEPSKSTLRKYGLSREQWHMIAQRQNWTCAMCSKLPPSNRLAIDHEHRKGFKAMPASEKRKYVRGLLCSYDNRYRVCKNTPTTAKAVLEYLCRPRMF
jgi:hypothetical protein